MHFVDVLEIQLTSFLTKQCINNDFVILISEYVVVVITV
jgi:hypothetical protein